MAEEEQSRCGGFGAEGFLSNKLEILYDYDVAKVRAESRDVSTEHGNVAEASFRRWLEGFLPARFGVTSGYIVSQLPPEDAPKGHFDAIIYDRMEAPTLWYETTSDRTSQGTARAIPAEFVYAVYEVKAKLDSKKIKQSKEKLLTLASLLDDVDDVNEYYPRYLPASFHFGIVFFEWLLQSKIRSSTILQLAELEKLRGYIGGIVLRGENLEPKSTGMIGTIRFDEEQEERKIGGSRSLPSGFFAGTKQIEIPRIEDKVHLGLVITWFDHNFAQFSFEMLRRLQGRFRKGRIPSGHGMNW